MRVGKNLSLFQGMADLPLPDPLQPEPDDYDATDPTRDRQRAAEASLREDRLREIEAAILSTPSGREWLWGVLASLHAFEARIAMTQSEFENGFWAGEREAGIRLLRRFARVSPESFARMFVENDHG